MLERKKVSLKTVMIGVLTVILTLLLYDFSSAKELVVQVGHAGDVSSLSFGPDGRYLASGSWDNKVKIWDVEKGILVKTLRGHFSSVNAVSFSPRGKYVASGDADGKVIVWNVKSGKAVKTFNYSPMGYVWSVSFSPDGMFVAAGGDLAVVKIWNVESGKLVKVLKTDHLVHSISFSPDGKYVASAAGRFVKIWSFKSGELVGEINGHSKDVTSVSFSPDGKYLATGSRDKTVKLWDTRNWKLIKTFRISFFRRKSHFGSVEAVSFSPDSKYLASAGMDGTVRLWNVESGDLIKTIGKFAVCSITFSPDGRYLAIGLSDGTIKLWNVRKEKFEKEFKKEPIEIYSVTFSPDGRYLATSSNDYTIRLWDLKKKKLVKTIETSYSKIYSVAFSPDGKYLAFGDFNFNDLWSIRIWDIESGYPARSFHMQFGDVLDLAYSPDGKYLATLSEMRLLSIWNLKTGKVRLTFFETNNSTPIPVECGISFSPNNKWIAVSSCGYSVPVKVWDFKKRKTVSVLKYSRSTSRVAFSPDGKYVAGGGIGFAYLWDAKTGKIVREFDEGIVSAVAFTPNGRFVVFAYLDGVVDFYNVKTGKLSRSLKSPSDSIVYMDISHDGKFLVTGNLGNTFRLWDLRTGKVIATFYMFPDATLVVTPEGRITGTGNFRNHVIFLDSTSR